jgi:prepilin-type N-terminal cleavage/methylation domain-containing protein
MNKKKGFTLIELLAIIVILAIIAVITVPIILNIIEESKKGAAKDSAYGYKDSVNKYYTQQLLNNQNLKLNDTYTVTNGTLSGGDFGDSSVTSFPIQLSGTVPTSGSLTYENNVLKSGCLVVGEYAVTFEDGNVKDVEKGECMPTIASCPGCKFIYTTSQLTIGTTTMESLNTTDDYRDITSGQNSHQYFLGLIAATNTGKIGRAFACGIEDGTPFCLEGYDSLKYSYNVGVLNSIFTGCNADTSDTYAGCNGSNVYTNTDDSGLVYVGDNYGTCDVDGDGKVYCYEE